MVLCIVWDRKDCFSVESKGSEGNIVNNAIVGKSGDGIEIEHNITVFVFVFIFFVF